MSTVLVPSAGATADTSLLDEVRRTAFYFESQGRWLFGFLHRRASAPFSRHGVLICPPVGHEQIHAQRNLRHLADALAKAGFPVVRFDYDGTGDSDGTEEDPHRHATWLANVGDARTWMQRRFGCERVSLLGLRLGASLAAEAAGLAAVDNLILWAPVVKGRAYLRELKAFALASSGAATPPRMTAALESGGFVVTEDNARDLARLDLLQVVPRCRRALIVARDDAPSDPRLLEHLKSQGTKVEEVVGRGYAGMMADPHYTVVNRQAIVDIVDWLLAERRHDDRIGDEGSADNAMSAEEIICSSSPARPPIRERLFPIVGQTNLFGIVSEPLDGRGERLPFIVLVNAGSTYRVGPHRLYVTLSRQLATRGFRCLRLDLCGLGDSVCSIPERENDPYPATAFRDLDLTLQHLQRHLGVERVVLMGLCSGAYAAFQSAAQLTNPALVESVLINPMTFFWKEGMSQEETAANQLLSFQEWLTSAWQPGKLLRFLMGRSKLGLSGVMRILRGHWRLLGRLGREQALNDVEEAIAASPPSHPLREDLTGDLQRVMEANRHLAFFFARSDPGYRILTLSAKRKVKELRRAGRMSIRFFDNADHTFSHQAPRRALVEAITEHLCRRYAPATGPSSFDAARCSASTRPR